jgi:hypothetical protein
MASKASRSGRNYPPWYIVDVRRCLETQQTGNVVLTVSGDHKTQPKPAGGKSGGGGN